ncbi:hypothetical protein [Erwinia sp. Leaf53]|uniref:hypothetical protein n=1 Tax=Erwinia sp. Leaf53 TaxID=1736225 RepID=UPI0006F93FEB|nr:hypothetical protein [Erwinia sp. Leaf53]KQN53436.1 hypothetical protein ASF13_14825 [Erwinia sp. Leaf53]
MQLAEFLTEYDQRLTAEINSDPLGNLVIWSAFGQRVFRHRLSSISNDVRQYTLNLLHHAVIKRLTESGDLTPADYPDLNSLAFKHACLTYLENLFVYSMLSAQDREDVVLSGVPGIRMGQKNRLEKRERLLFSHRGDGWLLERQTLLGISGRYKTPMMEMQFFDRHYHYSGAESGAVWQRAQVLLGHGGVLHPLFTALVTHLQQQLALPAARRIARFSQCDPALAAHYVAAFRSREHCGSYAREFWLEVTGLDDAAAGALGDVILQWPPATALHNAEVFRLARAALPAGDARQRLDDIRLTEPLLTGIDLLFRTLTCRRHNSLRQIEADWRAMQRDAQTLPALAVQAEQAEVAWLAESTAGERRRQLLDIARAGTLAEQIALLLSWHQRVMALRGQLPWLRETAPGRYAVSVLSAAVDEEERQLPGRWKNSYYLPQFQYLLQGLWGNTP